MIGFTEGDGSFIVNKNGTLEFRITQSSKDAQVLFYIKKELGFGSVSVQDKKTNAKPETPPYPYKLSSTHCFRVRNKEHFLKLIQIYNGNLYTDKKNNQFKLWLEAFNKYYNTNISLIENVNNPTLDNA